MSMSFEDSSRIVDSSLRSSPPTALVTGGGRGIGRAIVHALARAGFAIGLTYRSGSEAAQQTVSEALSLGAPQAWSVAADSGDLTTVETVTHEVASRFGRLDLLVNNAGMAPRVRSDVLETTPESWDEVMNANLKGVFFLTQRLARLMMTQPLHPELEAAQIHFIGSISADHVSLNRVEYCVSKAGIATIARAFALRLADSPIRVVELRPGLIRTDMTERVADLYTQRIRDGLVPIPRWGTPEDVGRVVAQLARSPLPYATGVVLPLDGGLHLQRL